jgi:hypothetical protein
LLGPWFASSSFLVAAVFVSGSSDPLEASEGLAPFFDRGRFSASFVRLQGGEPDRAKRRTLPSSLLSPPRTGERQAEG